MKTPTLDSIVAATLALTFATSASAVPVAGFSIDPDPAFAGEPVTFDGSLSYDTDPARTLVLWEWDFDGDGTYDLTGPVVASHTYPFLGTFSVGLRVTNDAAQSATAVASLTVQSRPLPEPGALALLGIVLGGIAITRRQL